MVRAPALYAVRWRFESSLPYQRRSFTAPRGGTGFAGDDAQVPDQGRRPPPGRIGPHRAGR